MDPMLYDRVEKFFSENRQQIVEKLMHLVEIPSVAHYGEDGYAYGRACHEVMDEWQRMAKEMGFSTARFDDHAACAAGTEGLKSIGLWAHLDVVPAGNGWQFDPFRPVLKKGFLIGRGADDNKSAAVGGLYLMKCVQTLGLSLPCGIRVYAGCDEECGSRGVSWFAAHEACPDYSIVPDSGYPVCHGEKGIINVTFKAQRPLSPVFLSLRAGEASNVIPDEAFAELKKTPELLNALPLLKQTFTVEETSQGILLTVKGRAGHAAFPQGSDNAVKKLTDALAASGIFTGDDAAVLSFLSLVNADFYGTALGIAMEDEPSGKLSCVGTVLRLENGFPCLTANIRYPVTKKGSLIEAQLRETALAHGFTVSVFTDSAPNYVPTEHPLVETLTRVYNEITGEEKQPYVMSGGTYARELPNAVGFGIGGKRLPPCDFLPSGHGGAHQPDEALYIDDYIHSLVILTLGVIEAARKLG